MFEFQSNGNRFYHDREVKVKLETIKSLKRMNDIFPASTADYDSIFLRLLLKDVFSRKELIQCGRTMLINGLGVRKLKFAKCV